MPILSGDRTLALYQLGTQTSEPPVPPAHPASPPPPGLMGWEAEGIFSSPLFILPSVELEAAGASFLPCCLFHLETAPPPTAPGISPTSSLPKPGRRGNRGTEQLRGGQEISLCTEDPQQQSRAARGSAAPCRQHLLTVPQCSQARSGTAPAAGRTHPRCSSRTHPGSRSRTGPQGTAGSRWCPVAGRRGSGKDPDASGACTCLWSLLPRYLPSSPEGKRSAGCPGGGKCPRAGRGSALGSAAPPCHWHKATHSWRNQSRWGLASTQGSRETMPPLPCPTHWAPVSAGGHRQAPVLRSQRASCSHWHCSWQPAP